MKDIFHNLINKWKAIELEDKIKVLLFLVVIFIAAFLRFAYLSHQGFWDGDEFASYKFLVSTARAYDLPVSIAGNMWGRPFGFFVSYLFLLIFGLEPLAIQIKCALMGWLAVVFICVIGERYIHRYAGLFAGAFAGTVYNMVFYSRTMKMTMPSVFFAVLAIWLLFSLQKEQTKLKYFLCGLCVGMMVTTHPASGAMGISILLIIGAQAILDWVKDKQAIFLSYGLWAFLGLLIPIIGCELFYFWAKYIPPIWHAAPSVDYFSTLYHHGHISQSNPVWNHLLPSFSLYLQEVKLGGLAFFWVVMAAQLFLCCFLKKMKKYAVKLIILFWLPIVLYAYIIHSVAASRNVITSMIPAVLLCGALFAEIVAFIKSVKLRIIMVSFFTGLFLIYGSIQSFPIIKNSSAAQNIYDHLQIGRASLTAPYHDKDIYQWDQYYFVNPKLYASNWEEVFRNFISRRAPYLVRLIIAWTNNPVFYDPAFPPDKIFNTVDANKHVYKYGLYDFINNYSVFEKKFNFKLVGNANLPNSISLKANKSMTLNSQIKTTKNNYYVSVPPSADFLILTGRLPLSYHAGDLLVLALGTSQDPYRYDLQLIQAPRPSPMKPKQKKVSIFQAWRVLPASNSKVKLSLLLISNHPNHRVIKLTNFSAKFFSLPKKYMALAKNTPKLLLNVSWHRHVNDVLSRFMVSADRNFNRVFPSIEESADIVISPNQYAPNTFYKLTFRGRATLFRGYAAVLEKIAQGGFSDMGATLWFKGLFYRKYHIIFRTPALPRVLLLRVREGTYRNIKMVKIN